jgi:tRNA (guanine37-N1)-methyltransferase
MVLDAMLRLLPGVLNDAASAKEDSFYSGGLDHPHFTRPEVFEGRAVPAVLLSGDHAKIAAWRAQQAAILTKTVRPDLLKQAK